MTRPAVSLMNFESIYAKLSHKSGMFSRRDDRWITDYPARRTWVYIDRAVQSDIRPFVLLYNLSCFLHACQILSHKLNAPSVHHMS